MTTPVTQAREAAVGDDQAWLWFADAVLALRAAQHRATNTDGPAVAIEDLETAVSVATQRLHSSLRGDGDFAVLAANAGLDTESVEVLALAAATEQSRARQLLLAFVHPDLTRPRMMLDTVQTLLGSRHVLALASEQPLRTAALVELVADGSWSEQTVTVHPTVLWALAGTMSRDPDLPLETSLTVADHHDGAPLVVVVGPDRMRRRHAAALHTSGDRFLVVTVPATPAGWSALVREATLMGCSVIVEIDDGLPEDGRRWIGQATHLPWAISTTHDIPVADLPARPWVEVEVADSAASDDERTELIGPEEAARHKLSLDQLHTVARVLPARGGDLDAAVRRLGSGKLERLARRTRPTRTWDDIVLTDDQLTQLHGLVTRYRYAHRVYGDWGFSAQPSSGIVAIFSGASGTGKTLASEIVAGELGLDMFKLDLSSVVSKYIGETEKNLEEVFNAASTGNMVLFFDEADSLFGKRSEVRDAHDRYANLEVSYLLQRLESFEGLVILATNFEQNIDEAFLRRIHVRVEFPLPGVEQRHRIWQINLPASAPVGEVDLRWLAERFEVPGATIRNATIFTAFAAAQSDTSITMEGLVLGVAHELRKAGRLLKPDHFGPYASLILPG